MRNIIAKWLAGIDYLLQDYLISYYTYFTIALAELGFLWGHFSNIAISFSCLLLASMLNIVICAYFKGRHENTKKEKICSVAYIVNFLVIIIVGMFFNWLATVILFGLPVIITIIWIGLANLEVLLYLYFTNIMPESDRINNSILNAFALFEIVQVLIPCVLLFIGLFETPLTLWLKCLLMLACIEVIPLIAKLSNDHVKHSIFELAKI